MKELLKIVYGVGGISFSESVVSLQEQNVRNAILRNSKLAAEDQKQCNRQQPRGRNEHDHKHSRSEREEAESKIIAALYCGFRDRPAAMVPPCRAIDSTPS